jgi:DNA replication protein DnaC
MEENKPDLKEHLKFLGLPFMQNHCEPLAEQAAQKNWTHVDYLSALAEGEASLRRDRSIQRKIRMARFPVVKTLEQFRWSWPSLINRAVVQNLFRLKFIDDKANVIFLGGVGLGNYAKYSVM